MMKRISITLTMLALIGLISFAQQNVTIQPGDDVLGLIRTVVDEGSTITFAPGHYKVAPRADRTGLPDLMRLPSNTTVRGAGSGMDPTIATIIDGGFTFDSIIKIDDNISGCLFEDMTVMNTMTNVIEFDNGSSDNTFNNVWALNGQNHVINLAGSAIAEFNFCAFGWCTSDTVRLNDSSFAIFTNCDIFLGTSDIVEIGGNAEGVFRNCIFYAGPGSNDLESVDGGFITVANSVGWDPLDSDPPGITGTLMGRLDLNGPGVFLVGDDNVGEDPLYVAPPGMGYSAKTMNLYLQDESPALTAGNTAFDNDIDNNPIGDVTFAGSQGPVPAFVEHWSLF